MITQNSLLHIIKTGDLLYLALVVMDHVSAGVVTGKLDMGKGKRMGVPKGCAMNKF